MDINWPLTIIIAVVILALLVFLIMRNQKDEKEMESTMNQAEEKPPHPASDNETNI